jgi:hypothetical protein
MSKQRITEGTVKKGGQNTEPKTTRPAAPKGQGGAGNGKPKAPAKPSRFLAPPCPNCNSADTFVESTRGYGSSKGWKKRYCKCNACGETFMKCGPPQLQLRVEDDLQAAVDEGFHSLAGGDDPDASEAA